MNRTYHEMAEHYNTAIIPARVKAPDDKPNAEGSVNVMETWIIAALRHRQFFSFEELNRAVREKLIEYNDRPFTKRKGSRQSAFTEEECEFLQPLPASRFEMAVWSKAKIQPDYLIQAGNCKYSVPYEYIGKAVDIRTSEKTVEVFYHNNRIALHVKRIILRSQYTFLSICLKTTESSSVMMLTTLSSGLKASVLQQAM